MSENCTHDCSTCSAACDKKESKSLIEQTNDKSNIKKVIGVVSGKGGVGKSLVTSMLAVKSRRANFNTAILDADITGPSIPQSFGLHERVFSDGSYMYPAESKSGIKIISANLMLNSTTDPIIWRGPVIAGAVKQFWTDVVWGDVDYMFVDMPPGTGDVPLTVFQSIPLDGIIIVTSPQELVGIIVEKAAKMANMMNIPILGIVENMSYFTCPDCNNKHYIFGKSNTDIIAAKYGIDTFVRLPIIPDNASLVDKGNIEEADIPELDAIMQRIQKLK